MATITLTGLPVEAVLPQLAATLIAHDVALLEAAPGAGKTTLVPLALRDADWLDDRKIVMLEPRRVATRAAAWRMAELLAEPVGETVGYAMRFERRIGPTTRIEVLTEGLFMRRLQADPELSDVGLVIVDEFHERSLDADLALTLCLDLKTALRPDLRLLLMSATLPGDALASCLGDPPVIRSQGRSFPVTTYYRPSSHHVRPADHVASIVQEALTREQGSILVFLPGVGEINRVAGRLGQPPGVRVLPLHGSLDRDQQLQAILPGRGGERKIVLATNIAETSLTIEDVNIVIDSGLERRQRYSPRTGMSRLETGSISRASADQRRGRAGRTGPGICYRLWSEPEDRARVPHHPPEIMEADLAPLLLELAAWGVRDTASLTWPSPPPEAGLREAHSVLRRLGLIDHESALTELGRRAAGLPLHPRLATMVLTFPDATGVMLAALLSGRDPWRERHRDDLATRLESFARERPYDLRRITQQLARTVGIDDFTPDPTTAGAALARAFPDRVARRRAPDDRRYQLANGRGATLDAGSGLEGAPWLVIADLDDTGVDARIRLAAAVTAETVEAIFLDQIETSPEIFWDEQEARVKAVERQRLDHIILRERLLDDPDPQAVQAVLLKRLRKMGVAALPWTDAARQLRARVTLARRIEPDLPAWDDDHLWKALAPFLIGLTRLDEVQSLDLAAILEGSLSYGLRQRLEDLAPRELETPAGTRARIDYLQDPPVMAGKLQTFFGWRETPTILRGRLALAIQLLSPAGRPLQVTRDLESFWRNGYGEVRKEMRGRYPKHPWPEDPLAAEATVRTKRRVS